MKESEHGLLFEFVDERELMQFVVIIIVDKTLQGEWEGPEEKVEDKKSLRRDTF